jgi:hypothetical protein
MKTLVILASLAGVAHAQPAEQPATEAPTSTWSIDGGTHTRWLGATSGAILTSETMYGSRITLGRSLTTVSARNRELDVGLFARWVYAEAAGTIFQNLDTDLSQHALTGGLRVDAPLWWRVRLVGQAEAGMARTALTVTQDAMTPVQDHSWGLYAAASLGADLAIHDGPKFRLGLAIDLGYTVTSPVELHALPGDRPDENLSIPTSYASIGKLDTRGVTYSMALRGSF